MINPISRTFVGARVENREKAYDGFLVMNQQRPSAPPWPEGRGPERRLVAVEKKDFQAIRKALAQLFDLAIEALRTIAADDQQTRDPNPVCIRPGTRGLFQAGFLGFEQGLRIRQTPRESPRPSHIKESGFDRSIQPVARDPRQPA